MLVHHLFSEGLWSRVRGSDTKHITRKFQLNGEGNVFNLGMYQTLEQVAQSSCEPTIIGLFQTMFW